MPAADTVARNRPWPLASQRGSSARDAYTCAMTFTCHAWCHIASGAVASPPGGDAGVGTEQVQRTVLVPGEVDEPVGLVGVGDVTGEREAVDLVGDPAGGVGVEVVDDHLGAERGEAAGEGRADPQPPPVMTTAAPLSARPAISRPAGPG